MALFFFIVYCGGETLNAVTHQSNAKAVDFFFGFNAVFDIHKPCRILDRCPFRRVSRVTEFNLFSVSPSDDYIFEFMWVVRFNSY